MTPFEHLSVLISIILGLGITHVLWSVQRLIQARERVRLYWMALVWTALVFTAQVEWWWVSFDFRRYMEWNFFYFLFVLMSPVSLYLAGAFVLPQIEAGEDYDLEEYYYQTRGWLFGALALSTALDAVRRALQAGSVTDPGAWTNILATATVASLAVVRNKSFHAVVTLFIATLFLFFIVTSALELG